MHRFTCSVLILIFCGIIFPAFGQGTTEPALPNWLTAHEGVSAGFLQVPENHDQPEGRQIRIAYAVVKAKEPVEGAYPMIFFSGGPGGETLDEGLLEAIMDHPFRLNRDVILFDQRGIGFSSALPDMSFDSFEILAMDASPEEELSLTQKMISEYKRKCQEQNIEPSHYNTQQSARDVRMLFEHLGYSKYNLFGGSYGTRLARVVQDLVPKAIHSSVMDSPAPLSGDFLLNRLNSYSLSLSRIFEYCEASPGCKKAYPELKTDYFKAIERLGKSPLKVTLGDSIPFVINAQDGVYLIRRLLYQDNSREKTPELIQAYLNGSGEVLQEVLEFEYRLTGGLNLTMLLSVEKYENFNPENTPAKIKKMYREYPLVPVELGFFDAFYQAGMGWHSGHMPLEERHFSDSEIPSLIFVNRYDPVTPPENGVLFKERLSNGTLLVLDEGGHGGGNRNCKDQVIVKFMEDPTGALDVSCLNLFKE
jgi:pimeloyl-ACP methyl ester carboxylesterase